jgi:hypothetical protein
MPTQKLTPEIIAAAIEGFESQKRRIDDQIAELRSMLPGGSTKATVAPETPGRKRRKFSTAARRRMREAQQRRWAKTRGESEPPATLEPSKPKRRLSKAGKAAIVAALKKRWATKKAEAAKAQSPVAKKSASTRKKAKKAAKKAAATKKAPVVKTTAKAPAPSTTQAAG